MDTLTGVSLSASSSAVQAASSAGLEQFVLLVSLFAIAVLLGVELITKVPPTLHTPLMSGSNAISGITLVGALVAAGSGEAGSLLPQVLGFIAVVLATINVVGGFMVTHRMLGMFKRRD